MSVACITYKLVVRFDRNKPQISTNQNNGFLFRVSFLCTIPMAILDYVIIFEHCVFFLTYFFVVVLVDVCVCLFINGQRSSIS